MKFYLDCFCRGQPSWSLDLDIQAGGPVIFGRNRKPPDIGLDIKENVIDPQISRTQATLLIKDGKWLIFRGDGKTLPAGGLWIGSRQVDWAALVPGACVCLYRRPGLSFVLRCLEGPGTDTVPPKEIDNFHKALGALEKAVEGQAVQIRVLLATLGICGGLSLAGGWIHPEVRQVLLGVLPEIVVVGVLGSSLAGQRKGP